MLEFKLPAIGEGVVEGEIVRWLKQPGEAVAANEALVEVMTDKATVEIPSPVAAVLREHKRSEGEICPVGGVLALLEAAGAPAAVTPAPAAPPSASAAAAAPARAGDVLATPAARALAREQGIDLRALGSDTGRITRDDVLRAAQPAAPTAPAAGATPGPAPTASAARSTPAPAAATPAPAASRPAPPAPASAGDSIPFRGLRRKIAEGMTRSYTTAVHYTYVEQVDMTKLVAVRDQARRAAEESGVRLNYLPFIVKAVVHGLRRFPIVNAELDEPGARIVLKKRYSIGIATATPNGLMVPVVHDADRLSILDIAREVGRVSDAARSGTAKLEELTGSTFTITSLGQIGGVLATPILNYPEVGILGVHAIRKVPVVDDQDRIVIGHVMNLSVSLDHRVVDGFEGASFLQEVRRYLEDPTLLLLSGI
jgi:pyruvate dehydrogenase E2 component (dihydrolipoamide acetyltransferase)